MQLTTKVLSTLSCAKKQVFIVATLSLILNVTTQGQPTYPPRIFADTVHYPFLYGVASGDPDTNSVLLWTKVAADARLEMVNWIVAEDSAFTRTVTKGQATVSQRDDNCIKISINTLKPAQQYYYRFSDAQNRTSVIGRARTLPGGNVSNVRFAVVSCSSVWSGYFNAYKQIAKRDDIDFLVHLGDYVYDFVDKGEEIRVPSPYPPDPSNLEQWRERHTYYLLDPDLRAARAAHTWIAEWDNHDINGQNEKQQADAIKAFYEYVPVRIPDESHPERIYRPFHFGNLIHLNMIDMNTFRGKEEFEPGKKCVLGNAQQDWLIDQLTNSTAQWNLLGNQEMMSDWLSEGAPKIIKVPGNGRVFDESNWNGCPEDRERLFNFIRTKKVNNVVVMTGDAHMSFVMNLTSAPKDKTVYNKKTAKGSLGVEFVTPSVTRGNFNENGIPSFFASLARLVSLKINPHHIWNQFTKHGYCVLDVNKERVAMEFWYVKILKSTDKQKFGRGYICRSGENHWDRKPYKKKRKSSLYNFGLNRE